MRTFNKPRQIPIPRSYTYVYTHVCVHCHLCIHTNKSTIVQYISLGLCMIISIIFLDKQLACWFSIYCISVYEQIQTTGSRTIRNQASLYWEPTRLPVCTDWKPTHKFLCRTMLRFMLSLNQEWSFFAHFNDALLEFCIKVTTGSSKKLHFTIKPSGTSDYQWVHACTRRSWCHR